MLLDQKETHEVWSKDGTDHFSSALISELDIVLLGLFFGGPLLGVCLGLEEY